MDGGYGLVRAGDVRAALPRAHQLGDVHAHAKKMHSAGNAQLARSDSIGATLTGDLAITNSRANGALISGDLALPEVRYQIIRQGAAHYVDNGRRYKRELRRLS